MEEVTVSAKDLKIPLPDIQAFQDLHWDLFETPILHEKYKEITKEQLEYKLEHAMIRLHRFLTQILDKNNINHEYLQQDSAEESLSKIQTKLFDHIDQRKKALPEMQQSIVEAFGLKVNNELQKVDGSIAKLDKSFRRHFEEIGFKLEQIVKNETLINKIREESKVLELEIEEYKKREGEFEELKKTIDGYKKSAEDALKLSSKLTLKFQQLQESQQKKEEEKKEEDLPAV